MVVMKLEFRIRAHFRGDVQMGKRAERVLFRRAAVVVRRTEVEQVRGVAERSRVAGGIEDRKVGAPRDGVERIEGEASWKGSRGTTASKSLPPPERACTEVTARLQHGILLLVAEEDRRIASVAGEVAPHQETIVLDIAVVCDVARNGKLGRVGRGSRADDVGNRVVLLVIVKAAVDV